MSLITSVSNNNEIVYNDAPTAKQRYKLNGKPVVGVTTFIKAGFPTSEALVNWKIGKAAEYTYDNWQDSSKDQLIKDAKQAWRKDAEESAGIGTIVHEYAYLSSLNKHEEALKELNTHQESDQWEKIISAVRQVDDYLKDTKDKLLYAETTVGSLQKQFAGRFDRLVKRDGKVIITDYKTSKGFYLEQFIQDGAYAIAIEEWLGLKVEGFEVVRFGKEGGDFKSLLITKHEELEEFKQAALKCLHTYNFLKIWNKDPRFAWGGNK